MWEDLIVKAKQGGLDVIDTYVFWNAHEPSPGKVPSLPLFSFGCIYSTLCLFFSLFLFSYLNFFKGQKRSSCLLQLLACSLWLVSTFYNAEYIFNFAEFLFFILFASTVQLWREVWSGQIHEDYSESWSLCPSQNWSLCLCWVELWVSLFLLSSISCWSCRPSSCVNFIHLYFCVEDFLFGWSMFLESNSEQIMSPSRSSIPTHLSLSFSFCYQRYHLHKENKTKWFKWILQRAMQRFTKKIVDLMKSNNLFESQGGPIILSQVGMLNFLWAEFLIFQISE